MCQFLKTKRTLRQIYQSSVRSRRELPVLGRRVRMHRVSRSLFQRGRRFGARCRPQESELARGDLASQDSSRLKRAAGARWAGSGGLIKTSASPRVRNVGIRARGCACAAPSCIGTTLSGDDHPKLREACAIADRPTRWRCDGRRGACAPDVPPSGPLRRKAKGVRAA